MSIRDAYTWNINNPEGSVKSFEDKVVLVTGGSAGIGRATAEEFIAEGAKVVVTARRKEPLEKLAAAHPGRLSHVQADAAEPGEAKRVVDFVLAEHGRLDVLVNNAGAYVMKPLAETTDAEILGLLKLNVAGLLAFSREALGPLAKTKGSIINISSTVTTGVMPGIATYSGTKAAVEHITRVLAAEVGPMGIRVNAVAPGATDTEMLRGGLTDEMRGAMESQTPLGRLGQPEDVARVVVLLAGPNASWITGQTVAASGGLML